MDLDVVTIGNATIDAFLTFQKNNPHVRLDEKTQDLCVKSGEKIEVETSEFLMGGNASNVAVGLSRLGLKTSLCAEIGDDELSEKILKTLYKENVDFRLVKRTKNAKTSFAVAINVGGERTLFVQHIPREHNFNLADVFPKWIYLTSLGHEWKKPYQKVFSFVEKTGTKLACNPGTLQIQEGGNELTEALKKSHIVFLNKEEAQRILNLKFEISNENTNAHIKQLLQDVQKLGPRVVIITDGEKGSFAIDETGTVHSQGIVEAEVVEKTGAGDSYATGFLAAIIQGNDIKTSMQWGAINSSSVITKVGAQTGLLTKEELDRSLSS